MGKDQVTVLSAGPRVEVVAPTLISMAGPMRLFISTRDLWLGVLKHIQYKMVATPLPVGPW